MSDSPSGYAVLDPRWVTESIYMLLRVKQHPETDAILALTEAREALPHESVKMVTSVPSRK